MLEDLIKIRLSEMGSEWILIIIIIIIII